MPPNRKLLFEESFAPERAEPEFKLLRTDCILCIEEIPIYHRYMHFRLRKYLCVTCFITWSRTSQVERGNMEYKIYNLVREQGREEPLHAR